MQLHNQELFLDKIMIAGSWGTIPASLIKITPQAEEKKRVGEHWQM